MVIIFSNETYLSITRDLGAYAQLSGIYLSDFWIRVIKIRQFGPKIPPILLLDRLENDTSKLVIIQTGYKFVQSFVLSITSDYRCL